MTRKKKRRKLAKAIRQKTGVPIPECWILARLILGSNGYYISQRDVWTTLTTVFLEARRQLMFFCDFGSTKQMSKTREAAYDRLDAVMDQWGECWWDGHVVGPKGKFTEEDLEAFKEVHA